MKHYTVTLALVSALAVFAGPQSGAAEFNEDGFLMIDGRPRLVLGMYELPAEDADLKALADNGYNLVHGGEDAAVLDRIQAHGMHAWIALGGKLAVAEGDQAAADALAATIDAFKDHPALLCWEAPDEALWNEWYGRWQWVTGDQMKALGGAIDKAAQEKPAEEVEAWRAMLGKASEYTRRGLHDKAEALYAELWVALTGKDETGDRKLSQANAFATALGDRLTNGWKVVANHDPEAVRWQNHAPRNSIADMRHHNRGVDAAGCDIYPVPFNYRVGHSDLADMNLSSVGAYTKRMAEGAPGKAVWMVLQGFGWRDLNPAPEGDDVLGRRPTFYETRFMAYDALVNGAGAVLYWGTAYIEKDSQLWADLLRIGKELRALEPAIVAPRPAQEPAVAAEPTNASFDGGQPVAILRQANDECVLFVVNRQQAGLAFTVSGLPETLNGKELHRLYSDESVTPENGAFRDGILGFGVHVYATTRAFEVE